MSHPNKDGTNDEGLQGHIRNQYAYVILVSYGSFHFGMGYDRVSDSSQNKPLCRMRGECDKWVFINYVYMTLPNAMSPSLCLQAHVMSVHSLSPVICANQNHWPSER